MSKPHRNEISARLRRLPVDFLLALINATAILVIVAAILALIVMVRIDNLAGRVVTTMTEAVLSKIDLPSKNVLANLRNLTEEVRTLGNTLRDIKVGENPVIQIEIARLKEALTALNANVDRLTNTRTILTDEAIGQLGRAVTDTLMQMRGCASKVGQMQSYPQCGRGHPSVAPQTHCLLFFFYCLLSWFLLFLLGAPIVTSITPIRAGDAHG